MKRSHRLPFGAECQENGTVRFRLWAPAAQRVDLVLGHSLFALRRAGPGWFELITDQASAGSRYQFQIDGRSTVPDPASRFQPADVHQPGEVIDSNAFDWTDEQWRGRPWEEAVIYELHVGTFTPEGSFAGVERRLDYLADLGVTAVELMPVADFRGARNWGYDGVLPYAPDSSYGRPEDLKRLIQAAHGKGLMVLLDVVYNHFGPEGNYLRVYAPQFFTDRYRTPWGDAVNFDGPESRVVRDFFIHNALYWLKEFHLDGLRLDAVHAIKDDSALDVVTELAQTVRARLGSERFVHLVLENDDNAARYLQRNADGSPRLYDAQWNDDIHHACHVLVTGEADGYYRDHSEQPIQRLGRCLTEGFDYQGEISAHRNGRHRGNPTRHLPLTSFVSFLQNHDQVGNRACGERILDYSKPETVKAIMAILLLAPSPPLVFMGEEFGASTPFLFFCDFGTELAATVTAGRRSEFAKFDRFRDPAARASIPDPNAEQTFSASKLDWGSLDEVAHEEWLRFYQKLLHLRQKEIVPYLGKSAPGRGGASFLVEEGRGLRAHWHLGEERVIDLMANLSDEPLATRERPNVRLIYATFNVAEHSIMPPWSVAWSVRA